MKKFSKIFSLIAFLAAAAFTHAQSLDDILNKYYESIGGVEAWKSKISMRITGTTDGGGMTLPLTVMTMRPNMQRVEVDIQGQKFVESFDGEVAWTINPFMGGTEATRKTDEEAKEAAKNNFEDELIDYKVKGHTVSLEGKEDIAGAPAYKVKMVKQSGDEVYYFFDTEAYVPVMMRSFIGSGPMKGKAVETYVSDYQEVDGVMVPFAMEQKMDGQTFMNMKATKVEFNYPMEKESFMMPSKK
jgi:hypothetical protein